MTVYSQNGYSANDRTQVTSYTVTASGRKMTLRKGTAGAMLAHFVRWFDENIRDIDPGILDEWGYAERPIRGGVELSNHASGTAADVDATKWPLGVEASRYLTAAEIAEVHARLPFYQGCIRWGADYTGRKDPMHFEINRDQATVDRVWTQIQSSEEDDMPTADEVAAAVWRRYPITGRDVNGVLGKGTTSPEMLLASIAHDVLKAQVPNAARRANGETGATTDVATQAEWADAHTVAITNRLAVLEAKIDQIVNALLPPGKG